MKRKRKKMIRMVSLKIEHCTTDSFVSMKFEAHVKGDENDTQFNDIVPPRRLKPDIN
jgi:hypothetical protein